MRLSSAFRREDVRSYCKIPRHMSREVDLQLPLILVVTFNEFSFSSDDGIKDGRVGETFSFMTLFV